MIRIRRTKQIWVDPSFADILDRLKLPLEKTFGKKISYTEVTKLLAYDLNTARPLPPLNIKISRRHRPKISTENTLLDL